MPRFLIWHRLPGHADFFSPPPRNSSDPLFLFPSFFPGANSSVPHAGRITHQVRFQHRRTLTASSFFIWRTGTRGPRSFYTANPGRPLHRDLCPLSFVVLVCSLFSVTLTIHGRFSPPVSKASKTDGFHPDTFGCVPALDRARRPPEARNGLLSFLLYRPSLTRMHSMDLRMCRSRFRSSFGLLEVATATSRLSWMSF